MCLAIPGKLTETFDDHGLRMGRVDYAGASNTACLEYVPDAVPGQYLLVHAGFAISVLDEDEAQKTLALWDEMVRAAAEEGTDVFGMPLSDAIPDDAMPDNAMPDNAPPDVVANRSDPTPASGGSGGVSAPKILGGAS